MKKNVHIISHSHWDREWYMPFENHRVRLLKLIDDCMELFENDKDYKSFHLDGHTVLLEDYLEIKPQNEERIRKYVQEGKFVIGPWYVLQDVFLTSGEANIRNLLVGMEIAGRFGKTAKIGYFPDTFGNAGQMPQILKQAGIQAIAFGRGVKPTGMNNSVSENEDYQSRYSELYWQSPDGSVLPAVLFSNWYNNGWEIPVENNENYWNRALRDVEKYASTGELLVLNGCDHQPVQRNLSRALEKARENFPEYCFIHSDFEKYMEALLKELPKDLATIKGELTGQDTDGWFNLVNTASSHIDLKMMNKQCENYLENVAEPLVMMAAEYGKEPARELLLYAWKTLMKNHPHDSICGCNCDAVSEEMSVRFQKSRQAAQAIAEEALEHLSKYMYIKEKEDCDGIFAVVNTFSQKRSGLVSVDVDIRRVYEGAQIHSVYEKVSEQLYQGEFVLSDMEGNQIPCFIKERRARFGYELPDEGFRKSYVAETVTVLFEACKVPALGWRIFKLKKMTPPAGYLQEKRQKTSLVTEEHVMENAYLRVGIHSDGTIQILDKGSGRLYDGLLRMEDGADLGSEYTFIPEKNGGVIYSGKSPAKIELILDEEFAAEYKITVEMWIPKEADELAKEERNTYAALKERGGGRSCELVKMKIISYVSLSKDSRCLKVRTEFTNIARDHRLRVLFPTGMKCQKHKAESVFEMVTRENKKKASWTYPSGCERQQGFVLMQDEEAGLAIANTGLYEYEILADNTIALTILRAIGEMGDWGIFPTELSQVQTSVAVEYGIVPFTKAEDILMELAAFQYPLQKKQIFSNAGRENGQEALWQNGDVPDSENFVWQGNYLKPCAFKIAQDRNDVIMRWVNYSDESQLLIVWKTAWISNLYRSNVIEETGEPLVCDKGKWEIRVKPFEIVTLGSKLKNNGG